MYNASHRRRFWLLSLGVTIASLSVPARPCQAQLNRGFNQVIEVYTTGDERNRQNDLWVLEVHLKPMRLITVPITDAATGEVRDEQIWYLPYRAVNRPIDTRQDTSDTTPVNTLDAIRQPAKFIPEFTLMVYDDPVEQISDVDQIYMDEILPEAVAAINKVETQRVDPVTGTRVQRDPLMKNSVSVIQDIAGAAADGDPGEEWIYGVATWRGVDPDTDFFKVILSGFSNGYEIVAGPDGSETFWRKVLIQEFTRPGDRFDPNLKEFKFADTEWTYRPEAPLVGQ